MAARIVRLLTRVERHKSIRYVARVLKVTEEVLWKHLKKRRINTYQKEKLQLIPTVQRKVRRKCCMKFRKTYRVSDIMDLLSLDECYVTVQKHSYHQNDQAYGFRVGTHLVVSSQCRMSFEVNVHQVD